MIPDIEKIVATQLRADSAVIALAARIVGKTPSSIGDPWVRVTQLDGPSDGVTDRLVAFLVQLDCYAGSDGGQPEANLLGRTVRASLRSMRGSVADAVVTGHRIVSDARIPDTAFEPARERRVVTVEIWAHEA